MELKLPVGEGNSFDVGDLTGTVAVDSCAVAMTSKNKIVDNANIGVRFIHSRFILPSDRQHMKPKK